MPLVKHAEHPAELLPTQAAVGKIINEIAVIVPIDEIVPRGKKKRSASEIRDKQRDDPVQPIAFTFNIEGLEGPARFPASYALGAIHRHNLHFEARSSLAGDLPAAFMRRSASR